VKAGKGLGRYQLFARRRTASDEQRPYQLAAIDALRGSHQIERLDGKHPGHACAGTVGRRPALRKALQHLARQITAGKGFTCWSSRAQSCGLSIGSVSALTVASPHRVGCPAWRAGETLPQPKQDPRQP
jgi:hypothetical protein